MCVNTVVRFKIAALTFLLPHEHHHGGAHRVVTGYPVIGSPCQLVLEAGTRACPALLYITVGCHHPLQVNQLSWFRSVIYTLNLKMKGLPEACFGHACMSYGECRHGGRGSAPSTAVPTAVCSCIEILCFPLPHGLQTHLLPVLLSPWCGLSCRLSLAMSFKAFWCFEREKPPLLFFLPGLCLCGLGLALLGGKKKIS